MIYIVIAVLSALLTYYIRHVAIKKAILDIPNHRSSHQTPTPRGGGLAVVIAFYAGMLWLYATGSIEQHLFYALMTAVPIALTGLLDDILNLPASGRFAVQIISACAAICFLQVPWYLVPVALGLVVWFTNLFNFLDGIDGYVATETIFVMLSAYLFFHQPLLLILAAAVAGFLPFNWQKATIFMGDVGSTFIGFVTALFVLQYAADLSSLMIWLILTLPFWYDATYTLLRRFLNAERVTQPHRKHLFQRAVRMGYSHQSVTLGLLMINLSVFILLYTTQNLWLVSLYSITVCGIFTYFIERRMAFDLA